MPRVIVVSEPVDGRRRRSLTLNEHVNPVHMADEHSSLEFLERLAWAISDADDAEQRLRPRSRHNDVPPASPRAGAGRPT